MDDTTADRRTPEDEDAQRQAADADPLAAGAALGTDGGGIGAIFGLDALVGRGDATTDDDAATINAGEDAGSLADEPVDVSPWNELGGEDRPRPTR